MLFKQLISRLWDSPTATTWMSYSTKALSLFGVLPLVLSRFSEADIVLWYLFSTIIGLQGIADFGFRQTFSRIISYVYSGAIDLGIVVNNNQKNTIRKPNQLLMREVVSMMSYIYLWLTLILVFIMATLGTWSLMKPIYSATNVREAWISWIIILVVSCLSFYSKIYLNFLEGLNKIALVRRVEALTSTGTIITSIVVLFYSPTLLNLVLVNQLWVIIIIIRDWYLCQNTENGYYGKVSDKLPFNKLVFQKIWQPAWRTGISGLMSVGLTNLTGLIYAQSGNPSEVASYLLALRIINQIKEISMAPFYSKLPAIAKLRIINDRVVLLDTIKRGMQISHLVFVAGVVTIGLFSDYLLNILDSNVQFVDNEMWLLLAIAFFVHRFGAMHIQVYTSTNHIISHIADGVSGILYIISTLIMVNFMGIYAIPVGMLIGYLGFYSWYAAKYSYQSIGENFWYFEKKVSFIPAGILVIYIIFNLIYMDYQ